MVVGYSFRKPEALSRNYTYMYNCAVKVRVDCYCDLYCSCLEEKFDIEECSRYVTFLQIHYLQEINDNKILLLFFYISLQSNLVNESMEKKNIYIYIHVHDSLISIDRYVKIKSR